MLTPLEILQLLKESQFDVQVSEQVNGVLLQSMQIHFPHLFNLTYENGLHYIDYSRCINAKVNILSELLQHHKPYLCSSNYVEGNFRPDLMYCEESLKDKLNLVEIKCRVNDKLYHNFEVRSFLDKYNINSYSNRSLYIDYSNLNQFHGEKDLIRMNNKLMVEFNTEIINKKLIINFDSSNFNVSSFNKINKAVMHLKMLK